MKATAQTAPSEPLTLAQIEAKLTALDAQIARKQAEVEALRDEIPRLIAAHSGSDLAAPRERRRLTELADELHDLAQGRTVLEAMQTTARQREREEKFRADLAESRREGDELVDEAAAIRQDQDALVKRVDRFHERTVAWERKLPGSDPADFRRGELAATFWKRVVYSSYELSDGRWRLSGPMASPFEVREARHGDLKHITREHVTVALRNRQPRALTR